MPWALAARQLQLMAARAVVSPLYINRSRGSTVSRIISITSTKGYSFRLFYILYKLKA
jgi:hypothetical protein